jgi:hypothetical protein
MSVKPSSPASSNFRRRAEPLGNVPHKLSSSDQWKLLPSSHRQPRGKLQPKLTL